MERVFPNCAGLDVHKKLIVACRLTVDECGQVQKAIRKFGTMTAELEALADWLAAGGCTHVAMESTGVYVRRFTARAIPPTGRTGSGGNPRVNDLPRGESQRGQQHVVEAGRPRRRV